ncbi:MAG: hypothetical protein R8G66_12685 [Cytophagales bacterium]|nr:hypothetical protein [Cytophagales bacterium]
MNLSIVAFSSLQYPLSEELKSYCDSHEVALHELTLAEDVWTEKLKVVRLHEFLGESRLQEKSLILVVNGVGTHLTGKPEALVEKFQQQDADVLFAADANFNYPDGPLQYYHWKFYPRNHKYNYLDSDAFIGEVGAVRDLTRDINSAYHLSNGASKNDLYFTRYYLDVFLEIRTSAHKIAVDGDQQILAATRGSLGATKLPYFNWVMDHFVALAEVERSAKGSYVRKKVRGLKFDAKSNSFKNTRTGTNPGVVTVPREYAADVDFKGSSGFGNAFKSWISYKIAFWRFILVFIVNRFSINQRQTFRFEKHKNPDYEETMQKFLAFLKTGKAFTFAHFNDGELNFIRKYLNDDHKKTWNGRIQDQYDIPLAERLLDSIKYQQENYFIGVSCSTCAAPRRKVADELMGDYVGKIGAMVFHHNLFYLPQIISQMIHREMYFVMNDYQKLDILENLGVTVKEENKIKIPFVNSHKEYDNLKDRKFPEGSFVILMCGMLAKVLIRNWYELNPTVTFIALGSTMDDFIQLSNTKYRPYPKKLPLTRNVHLIKSFLFGKKKECPECYNITLG